MTQVRPLKERRGVPMQVGLFNAAVGGAGVTVPSARGLIVAYQDH